jgi:hypothetical protein
LDWLMQLPEWLNRQILDQIETIEEGEKVQYITSVERIGMEKGEVIGMEKGVVMGVVIGASGLLRRQLERRFGVLPEWALEQLTSASEQDLEAWADAILTAPTLEAVFNAD